MELTNNIEILSITTDLEYTIVYTGMVIRDTISKTDSSRNAVGLKTASNGSISVEYPVLRVDLGPQDRLFLKEIMTQNSFPEGDFANIAVHILDASKFSLRFQSALTLLPNSVETKAGGLLIADTVRGWKEVLQSLLRLERGKELDSELKNLCTLLYREGTTVFAPEFKMLGD